jgi:hypothetical protein
VETRGSQAEAGLGKNMRSCLKNKLNAKGLEVWLKCKMLAYQPGGHEFNPSTARK